jgi:hypothetical protein
MWILPILFKPYSCREWRMSSSRAMRIQDVLKVAKVIFPHTKHKFFPTLKIDTSLPRGPSFPSSRFFSGHLNTSFSKIGRNSLLWCSSTCLTSRKRWMQHRLQATSRVHLHLCRATISSSFASPPHFSIHQMSSSPPV